MDDSVIVSKTKELNKLSNDYIVQYKYITKNDDRICLSKSSNEYDFYVEQRRRILYNFINIENAIRNDFLIINKWLRFKNKSLSYQYDKYLGLNYIDSLEYNPKVPKEMSNFGIVYPYSYSKKPFYQAKSNTSENFLSYTALMEEDIDKKNQEALNEILKYSWPSCKK